MRPWPAVSAETAPPPAQLRKVAASIHVARVDDLLASGGLPTPAEHEQAARYLSSRRRRQFIAGRVLLRLALSLRTGRAPQDYPLRTLNGRPVLAEDCGPAFSLSHSGDWVGCALNSASICGFDLQQHVARSLREIAAAFFPPMEVEWLDRQSQYSHAFYQLWTLKEAWAKGMGLPLLAAMEGTLFAPTTAGTAIPGLQTATASIGTALTMAWAMNEAATLPPMWRWQGTTFLPVNAEVTPWSARSLPPVAGPVAGNEFAR